MQLSLTSSDGSSTATGFQRGRRLTAALLFPFGLAACEPDSTESPAAHEQQRRSTAIPSTQFPAGATWVESQGYAIDFVYGHEEMFGFDIPGYLAQRAPHLLPYAEAVSHFAGKEGISPRLLLALIEQASHAITDPDSDLSRPLGDLSAQTGFVEQLREFSARLSSARYPQDQPGIRRLVPQEAMLSVLSNEQVDTLAGIYRGLFPGTESERRVVERAPNVDLTDLGIQFPWLVGGRWSFGGAHTNNGSGTFPLSSLDFSKWESWGDTIVDEVVASATGTVKVHSSCHISVVLDDTWSVSYYHMDALKFQTGDSVSINDPIGHYANNEEQALCNGGMSSGPHVHWTLNESGEQRHLLDVVLSGWTIHPGNDSYDSDCSRMYLHRDEETLCPWSQTLNDGVPGGDTSGETTSDSQDSTTDTVSTETTQSTDDSTSVDASTSKSGDDDATSVDPSDDTSASVSGNSDISQSGTEGSGEESGTVVEGSDVSSDDAEDGASDGSGGCKASPSMPSMLGLAWLGLAGCFIRRRRRS